MGKNVDIQMIGSDIIFRSRLGYIYLQIDKDEFCEKHKLSKEDFAKYLELRKNNDIATLLNTDLYKSISEAFMKELVVVLMDIERHAPGSQPYKFFGKWYFVSFKDFLLLFLFPFAMLHIFSPFIEIIKNIEIKYWPLFNIAFFIYVVSFIIHIIIKTLFNIGMLEKDSEIIITDYK